MLFFLDNHQQINEMIYTPITLSSAKLSSRLEKTQALLTFLYGSPSPSGDPFFGSEHTSLFMATPEDRISEFSVTTERLTTNLWPQDAWPTFDSTHSAPGIYLSYNGRHWMRTFKGGRVYPFAPNLWLNHSQDLYSDLTLFRQLKQNWALDLFFNTESRVDKSFEERLLNSLRWYRRSISLTSAEDDSLLHLAIALESLLNLDAGEKITARFVDTVTILLGSTKRLDAWAEQFYQARSKIVHRGAWSNLGFYPNDSRQGKKEPNEARQPHRSLRDFGLRIYRMCLTAIVSGAYLAQRSKLQASFVPNEERMIAIAKAISENASGPLGTLMEIAQDVFDLDSYYYFCQEQVDIGRLLSVTCSMCQLFVDARLTTSDAVDDAIESLISFEGDPVKKYQHVEVLGEALREWRSADYSYIIVGESGQIRQMREDPALVLAAYVEFACKPGIKLQVRSATTGGDAPR